MVIIISCELWRGDCLELMNNIQNQSVDMILCDLPYGTTKNEWDKPLPFDKMWKEYNRDKFLKIKGVITFLKI